MNARKHKVESHRELPAAMPPLTEIRNELFPDGVIRVYEGEGKKGDIVALGFRLGELQPKDVVSVYVHGKRRFLSAVRKRPHLATAIQIREYAEKRGLRDLPHEMTILRESVRAAVSMEGPEKVHTIDGKPDDPKAKQAAAVLSDLGADAGNIRFDPSKFMPKFGL